MDLFLIHRFSKSYYFYARVIRPVFQNFIEIMQPWKVPEVLRPLYESSTVLAQKVTMAVRASTCANYRFYSTFFLLKFKSITFETEDFKLFGRLCLGLFHLSIFSIDYLLLIRLSAICVK